MKGIKEHTVGLLMRLVTLEIAFLVTPIAFGYPIPAFSSFLIGFIFAEMTCALLSPIIELRPFMFEANNIVDKEDV